MNSHARIKEWETVVTIVWCDTDFGKRKKYWWKLLRYTKHRLVDVARGKKRKKERWKTEKKKGERGKIKGKREKGREKREKGVLLLLLARFVLQLGTLK